MNEQETQALFPVHGHTVTLQTGTSGHWKQKWKIPH